MTNLLTRKVMDNMARQYRNENGRSNINSTQQGSSVNINAGEESLLLGIIKNQLTDTSREDNRDQRHQGVKKLNLEDLIGHVKQSSNRTTKCSSSITLEELAKKHSK